MWASQKVHVYSFLGGYADGLNNGVPKRFWPEIFVFIFGFGKCLKLFDILFGLIRDEMSLSIELNLIAHYSSREGQFCWDGL